MLLMNLARNRYADRVHVVPRLSQSKLGNQSKLKGVLVYDNVFRVAAIVPIIISLYGVGCVPQAYIFSLGPKVALNAMAFVIVNLLFGKSCFY